MDSENDIKRKVWLANSAFGKYDRMWLRNKVISEKTLLRLYNALVVPIFTYNISSMAAREEDFMRLDVCHRRHLRKIAGIKWPRTISNAKLYERFEAKPIIELAKNNKMELF